MKIKTDFVTNSSSASFVIAVKKDLSVNDIKEELLKHGDVKSYLDEYKNYWVDYSDDYDDNITEIMQLGTDEEKLDMVAKKLAQNIYTQSHQKYAMKLGDYGVFGEDGSSEDIEFFSNWLYYSGTMNSENIKISSFN